MTLELTDNETRWLMEHLQRHVFNAMYPNQPIAPADRDNTMLHGAAISSKLKVKSRTAQLAAVREVHDGKPHQAVYRSR